MNVLNKAVLGWVGVSVTVFLMIVIPIIALGLLYSTTEREKKKQYNNSSPERVPGKQGEIPLPWG